MKTTKTTYSLEFKQKAVELALQRGNLSAVARELNLSKETLKNWKELHHLGKLVERAIVQPKAKVNHDEEIKRLKRALYDAELERDILKKALGIFSKSGR